jgi:hypothetical protein
MSLELLIERWFAIGWLVFGLSHLLHPAKWAALFMLLRDRETGGLLVGTFNLLLGLFVILGHNVWTWGLPVIVTLAGWLMTLKSIIYLLFPRALDLVMPPLSGWKEDSELRARSQCSWVLCWLMIRFTKSSERKGPNSWSASLARFNGH